MKNLTVILLAAVAVGFAGFCEAATPKKRTRNQNRVGPYAGGLIGYSNYTSDQSESVEVLIGIFDQLGNPYQNLSSSTENTDIGYQAIFGYRFHRFFAAEFGLVQFGDLKSTVKADMDFGQGFVPASISFNFTAGGPLMSAIGILPIGEKLEMFGRVGYLFTSSERELRARIDGDSGTLGSIKGDSQDVVYGLGFSWNINQVYSIRAEYQQIDQLGGENRTRAEDLNVIGVGFFLRF